VGHSKKLIKIGGRLRYVTQTVTMGLREGVGHLTEKNNGYFDF
jgi:guanyl-specific ribonuclease Sa